MNVKTSNKFILFTLGEYYKEANSKLKEIRITISKIVFIDLIMRTNITKKKQRTIYKNLENLEKIRLISYKNHILRLTPKGRKEYNKIKKEVKPYLNLAKVLNKTELYRMAKKSQTVLQ